MNSKTSKKKNQAATVNIFERQEMIAKTEEIKSNLKASTWRELETGGKFDKNKKLSFISDNMLILGCDVGSETHYIRAIDSRGRELSFRHTDVCRGQRRASGWHRCGKDGGKVAGGRDHRDRRKTLRS